MKTTLSRLVLLVLLLLAHSTHAADCPIHAGTWNPDVAGYAPGRVACKTGSTTVINGEFGACQVKFTQTPNGEWKTSTRQLDCKGDFAIQDADHVTIVWTQYGETGYTHKPAL